MGKDIFTIRENTLSYGRGYVYSLQYHLVWCTKYRKKVLTDGLDTECKEMCIRDSDTTGTITITLPYGTDLTALKPALTLKGAVSVSPASGATVNLSSPVTYTVTAEDGTTKTYTVTAYTKAQPVSDKLWEDMLNHIGGNTSNTGKNTWWQKAKDMKKNNNYPKYW